MTKRRAILIAGPTASGKSAMALARAQMCGGFVVNADSMQVYDVLNVLTARPQADDLNKVEHVLYGHIQPTQNYSVAQWVSDVTQLLNEEKFAGRIPVFVGGTGLYFKALLGGLSTMPSVPDAIRQKWRDLLAERGAPALHSLLELDDPAAAQRIKPQDGQRIVRALEILEASGETISQWQAQKSEPLIDIEASEYVCLLPARTVLDERIVVRLKQMVSDGALDEVKALMALDLDPALPAMKAIGVPEFTDHIAGKTDIETAIRLAVISTRQYIKRQTTWLRHQMGAQWQFI